LSTTDFLSLFAGSHVYCAIDDKKIDHRLTHYHEGYDKSREQILAELGISNQKDYGAFFCVNELDRNLDRTGPDGKVRHRTSKMVTKIRAVWAEDDNKRDGPRTDFKLTPNIVVNSSPGKYHYYWLTTTDDLDEWALVMNGICNNYGMDGNAKDLVRVLRVPGFYHHKSDPHLVTTEIDSDIPYPWEQIREAFPPDHEAPPHRVNSKPTKNKKFKNADEASEAIENGTNFHGAIIWLLNHWVNKGITDEPLLYGMAMTKMNSSAVQDARWRARTAKDYLEANVRDCVKFVKDNPVDTVVELPDVDDSIRHTDYGYPPGLMGQLCREIYEMAPHPNEEVAIIAAFSLIAGIAGRQYNVMGTGLNLYTALLADSGVGKANIKDTINYALMDVCKLDKGISFKGASRFTGPKSLFDMLSKGLSRVCVFEESGLMQASRAGDQAGLTRVLLDIFSSSGVGKFAGGEEYSNKENSVPTIPSPSLTIAHVSTPMSYIKQLKSKDAAQSGEIARVWMIRSMRDKAYLNIDRRAGFSQPVVETIRHLVKLCEPRQGVESDTKQVCKIGTSGISIQADSNHWTDLENKYKHADDQLRRALTSRAFIKIIKISAICSLFNGSNDIEQEEYDWAQTAIRDEIEFIEDTVTQGSSDDMLAVIKGIVGPAISRIINNKYKDRTKAVPKALRGKGIFTFSNLTHAIKNNEAVKQMADDPERASNPKTGIQKTVEYMVNTGLIVKCGPADLALAKRVKVAYRITDDMRVLLDEGNAS
jgi:hypothetical protein